MARRRAPPAAHVEASLPSHRTVQQAIEALWLITVFLVPLVFVPTDPVFSQFQVPKITIFRILVGLMTMLWVLEWGLKAHWVRPPGLRSWWPQLKAWLAEEPTRWVLLAAGVFLTANILSTIFSSSRHVSMWGNLPAQDSYDLYTVVSYFLLFIIIATHLKTREQLWRLLGVTVAVGVVIGLYANLQHYGLDPISESSTERPWSTMGNPIFSSAVLVMTIPITLFLVLMGREGRRSWLAIVTWGSLVTVQLLAIVFMLSRGPWIGLGAGLLLFLALVWKLFGKRSLGKHILILGLTFSVALAIVLGPAVWSRSGDEGGLVAQPLVQRGGTIVGEVVGGSPNTRLSFWWNAAELMADTPWFEFESDSLSFARPVLGYGPAMYRYAAPLSSSVPTQSFLQGLPASAHNFIIHEWVELGLLGALSYMGLLGSIFTVGAVRLFRNREGSSRLHHWVLVALLAALGGRVMEQMTGIARVGDLALFWAILAAFVALPTVMRAVPAPQPRPAAPRERRARRGQRAQREQMAAATFFLALIIMGLLGTLTWVKNVNYAAASMAGTSALRQLDQGDGDRSLRSIDRAIELAPDNVNYLSLRVNILEAIKRSTTDVVGRQLIDLQIYESRKEAVAIRPLSDVMRLGLAIAALDLSMGKGQEERGREALEALKVRVDLLPGRWPPLNDLASGYLALFQPDEALAVLEQSLSITMGTTLSQSGPALHLQGSAYQQLGDPEKAVDLLEESLRIGIDDDLAEIVHQALVDLYRSLGDEARAEEHANP